MVDRVKFSKEAASLVQGGGYFLSAASITLDALIVYREQEKATEIGEAWGFLDILKYCNAELTQVFEVYLAESLVELGLLDHCRDEFDLTAMRRRVFELVYEVEE
jgi:hypothetical protein